VGSALLEQTFADALALCKIAGVAVVAMGSLQDSLIDRPALFHPARAFSLRCDP
jgi:hypothetical protein